jgi:Fe(3+) dicitrate transport protein
MAGPRCAPSLKTDINFTFKVANVWETEFMRLPRGATTRLMVASVCGVLVSMPAAWADDDVSETEEAPVANEDVETDTAPASDVEAEEEADPEPELAPAADAKPQPQPEPETETEDQAKPATVEVGDQDPGPERVAPIAQAPPSATSYRVPRIDVIGQRPEQLEAVPGSASIVSSRDLEQQAPTSANEALRYVPGVNVVDEEGIGLRPNIGIRGLNPSRSRALLVLEDGVPIALAPYGEPELYYAPSVERMESLEIVKGSGSILFGPQTIGGVLNYITRAPPKEFTLGARSRVGSYGYFMNEALVGDTVDNVGYHLSVMHQRFGGHRNLNLELVDVDGKVHLDLSPRSRLGIKLGVYNEVSNATYLGLTTPQYEADPSANFAIHDRLPVRRFAASAHHSVVLGQSAILETTVYGNNTVRNWQRQDYDRTDGGRDYERIIDGSGDDITGLDPSARPDDGSGLFLRNSTGNRNREFFVGGVEPRLTWEYGALGSSPITGELIVGTRLHGEQAVEQRSDGTNGSSRTGTIRDDETRTGLAWAAYAQNAFTLADRLRVTPGVRFEALRHGRTVYRTRVADEDGNAVPSDLDPPRGEDTTVVAVIPGLGVSYAVAPNLTAFAGVHRGFAPPRTKDAITSDGENLRLDAEYSWNYEIGARARPWRALYAEAAAFVLDFSNQVIPPAEAEGVVSDASLINAGNSIHAGFETAVAFDPAALLEVGFELPISLAYTFVHATFGDDWAEGTAGNRLPYAPAHMLSARIGFADPASGISAQVGGNYVSSQYTDRANTETASIDGLRGKLDGRLLLDARVGYDIPALGLGVFVAGKNLLNERYIASRAPQGIQPGMPLQVIAGASLTY